MFCVLGNRLVQEGNIERVKFQYSVLKNDIIRITLTVSAKRIPMPAPMGDMRANVEK